MASDVVSTVSPSLYTKGTPQSVKVLVLRLVPRDSCLNTAVPCLLPLSSCSSSASHRWSSRGARCLARRPRGTLTDSSSSGKARTRASATYEEQARMRHLLTRGHFL
ncbi:hypothetical protein EYF80_008592 [Liparis tanakae]|uniref:Uncharacterized protein n=1 Tax=Liparis tanakae TaxID=230148 RepID=A0A4Z2IUK9_9TELE|nr:hypothetical protein EYF80_008592 [Liparis tanakae]